MAYPESNKRRYKNTVSLAQALDMSPTLKRLGIGDGDKQMAIFRRWPDIVGDAVARNTQPVQYSKGLLTVSVSSAAWLHNLTMMKPQILANLSKELGNYSVKDIKFKAADFDMKRLKK
ncbi:MAG: DUF721 domain-containing protein [candidate division FCPU426 bacterium]